MSSYYGFLSYPHGGRASAFLLLSMACATVCTCFSVSTCRFAALEYQSEYGNFDQHFYASDQADFLTTYTVNVGLFTWLRPFDTLEWTDGSCAGYSELQRDRIMDSRFDSLRIVGIIAVLSSVSLFLFSLGVACLSLARLQRYLMIFCTMALAVFTGSAFLMTQSGICTEVGINPNCTMDQGGLVAIVGVIFWVLTCLILIFFIQPVRDSKLSTREKDKRRKEIRKKQLAMLKQLEELELDKRLQGIAAKKAPSGRRVASSQEEDGSSIRIKPRSSPPKPLPRRSQSWQHADIESPSTSHKIKPIPDVLPRNKSRQSPVVPEVLPRNKGRQSPVTSRKHKQPDSPLGSPGNRLSRQRSNSLLELYELGVHHQSEEGVEAVYTKKARPVKKRRLRGSSQEPQNTRAPPSRGHERIRGSNQQSRAHRRHQRYFEEEKKSSEREFQRRTFDTAFDNEDNYAIPSYMNSDVSTVVTGRSVRDVEVYIGATLDNVDSIIDDDEDGLDTNYLYEV